MEVSIMNRIIGLILMLVVSGIVGLNIGHAEYADIVLGRKIESMKKAGVKPVMFPHWFHRIRFKCKACHERIFILRRGDNDISMNKIIKGEYCGKCHNGIIAWEPLYCDRCHSWEGEVPPYSGPPPWETASTPK